MVCKNGLYKENCLEILVICYRPNHIPRIDRFNYLRLFLWVALLIDLLLKISYEEKLLLAKVDGYENYLKDSYKLIPKVY
jgi:hypothetical protein